MGDEEYKISFNNNGDLTYNGDKVMVGSMVSNEVSLVQNTGQSTTSVMSQKAVTDDIDAEKTRAKEAEENLDNKVTDLDNQISGNKTINVKISRGWYEGNGYGGLTDARFYTTQIIPAGHYRLKGLSGFTFEAYNYISDTQGTKVFTFLIQLAEATFRNSVVLTIKKIDNTAFTDDDIANVNKNFLVENLDGDVGLVGLVKTKSNKQLFVSRVPHSPTLASGEQCSFIYVTRHFNNDYDLVTNFGNKFNTANANFDFYEEILTPRVGENVSESHSGTSIFGGDTDHIVGLVVAAKNNADGDFPDNKSLVTGGFHGYNAISTRDVTPTMRELSKIVLVDGKQIANGESAYGDKCIIYVTNRIQGCNTEKADGSGREILEQRIRVEMTNDKTDVYVDYIALEDCTLYSMSGFAAYVPNALVRFIGSKTNRGEYLANNTLVRSTSISSVLSATRNGHTLNLVLDTSYGLGNYQENNYEDTIKAQITNVNKMYFRILGEPHPVDLSANEMVSLHCSYDVIE